MFISASSWVVIISSLIVATPFLTSTGESEGPVLSRELKDIGSVVANLLQMSSISCSLFSEFPSKTLFGGSKELRASKFRLGFSPVLQKT